MESCSAHILFSNMLLSCSCVVLIPRLWCGSILDYIFVYFLKKSTEVHVLPQLPTQHKGLQTKRAPEAMTEVSYGHEGKTQEVWKGKLNPVNEIQSSKEIWWELGEANDNSSNLVERWRTRQEFQEGRRGSETEWFLWSRENNALVLFYNSRCSRALWSLQIDLCCRLHWLFLDICWR